ncbi:MAG: helix-turn-helix domain-containing protein [Coprobacillaceae bacterium]
MYKTQENGMIIFKLQDILHTRKISKNHLSVISGVRFDTIHRFCKGDLSRIDLDILCRLCNALNCEITDIIEYQK